MFNLGRPKPDNFPKNRVILLLDGLSPDMMVVKKSVVENTNTNKYTLIVSPVATTFYCFATTFYLLSDKICKDWVVVVYKSIIIDMS